ncbi:2-oxoglutarate ferredoxin oxidoreductase subunit delta [Candidatus Kryptonium thompsonii]|uniref:4Fe-4S dicluster domain-containing protein n=1 Tax=Candidatus Kryptonium thompsonii TaxID=1633631 RepID=UPI00063E8560|nr:4Fe-4S dicluster domain-containing protein [Candidatus Kryptonium thompsoni]CUS80982.1 2-oxoglutarate ferredoxin oxidoreductase subunit delta [Candidatus Kryptonium thompsoni]CUS83696.1 2-oxoglutarate ferredoxin oxidoreductase subunit delta [Candidatus Kryptonium thompsoni]CUS87383.1 2-oxoglutarate ferredoxin oxidoreductase subunit delta [Candidatus Kryptonium thompsoni]CUS92016.1 2-oxoglutarate ferredoxin oxidoreductase subunit delta [Candidatus Kryptonium thompsoni]CUS96686.1 2-oxoglutara
MQVTLQKAFIKIDKEQCKGCTLCIETCPVDVLKISDKFNSRGYHYAEYVGDGCTGCGVCFYACPEPGAITVYKRGAIVDEEILKFFN